MDLSKIRKDLYRLRENKIIVFGSFLTESFHEDSDIDIALITETKDAKIHKKVKMEALGKIPSIYDIHIFESMPTIVQASILENYEVVFGNPPEIGLYLRRYRKEWEDFKHRFELPSFEQIKHRN